ncbi:KDEL endoplasmic reticulum protein retention receptor 1 [Phyllostomus discolor]|uniref:ER lumen protein-retaining receptor n=1 Tax=Phyllostomus discolor TaxID=89673 RepID=A0A833YR88_9CHIR|nr:KDEL endoplasmic reticulum protein retention receptor 1 [Phyllostomus discolor]
MGAGGAGRALSGTRKHCCHASLSRPLSSTAVCSRHLPPLPLWPLPPGPALCPCSVSSLQILWTFSIYLESVAILPQLFMVSKTGEAETITSHYLFALGVYRTLYLFNWIWRYHFEGFFDLIAIVAGLVQTVLYCDFFYLYITKVLKGKKLSLPA